MQGDLGFNDDDFLPDTHGSHFFAAAHFRREAERQESHLPSHPLSKKKLRRRRKPHASVSDNMVQARSAVDRQTSSVPPSPVRGL